MINLVLALAGCRSRGRPCLWAFPFVSMVYGPRRRSAAIGENVGRVAEPSGADAAQWPRRQCGNSTLLESSFLLIVGG